MHGCEFWPPSEAVMTTIQPFLQIPPWIIGSRSFRLRFDMLTHALMWALTVVPHMRLQYNLFRQYVIDRVASIFSLFSTYNIVTELTIGSIQPHNCHCGRYAQALCGTYYEEIVYHRGASDVVFDYTQVVGNVAFRQKTGTRCLLLCEGWHISQHWDACLPNHSISKNEWLAFAISRIFRSCRTSPQFSGSYEG
jgi:hypothetical protein